MLLAGAITSVIFVAFMATASDGDARPAATARFCSSLTTTASSASVSAHSAALSGSGARSSSLDRPPADKVIACVGDRAIDGALFAHWMVVARRSAGRSERHHNAQRREEVLTFLISSLWVEGQAAEMHVHVSRKAVHNELVKLRNEQFPTRSAYRRFLHRTGETVHDVLLLARSHMLIKRIQRIVRSRARARRGSHKQKRARSETQAMATFVRRFRRRWEARTYCRPAYTNSDCGHLITRG